MKKAGIILMLLGAVGTIIFGIKALQDSESFSIMGMDVAVSTADWSPVIISVVLLIAGLVLTLRSDK